MTVSPAQQNRTKGRAVADIKPGDTITLRAHGTLVGQWCVTAVDGSAIETEACGRLVLILANNDDGSQRIERECATVDEAEAWMREHPQHAGSALTWRVWSKATAM